MSLKDQLLAVRDCPKERVTLSDGVEVWVHGLTGGQAAEHQTYILDNKGRISTSKLRKQDALLVVLTCRDEGGVAVFSRDDIDAISNQPAAYFRPVVEAANRLSGIQSVEDMAKNSGGTDTDS